MSAAKEEQEPDILDVLFPEDSQKRTPDMDGGHRYYELDRG